MINKAILSLFTHFRKNNPANVAAFHTKLLFSVYIFFLLLTLFFSISLFLDWKVGSQHLALEPKTIQLFIYAALLVISLLVFYFTESATVLETKRNLSEVKYRWYFFVSYFILTGIVIYLIVKVNE